MNKGIPSISKAQGWVDVDKIGENGFYVSSVRAFLRKKDAKEWLENKGWEYLDIKTAIIK